MLSKPILEITSLANDQRRSGSGSFADSPAPIYKNSVW